MSRYIDVDAFDDTVQTLNEQGWNITRIDYKRMDRVLFEMPTADVVEVKHGEWKYDGTYYICSACSGNSYMNGFNYCPYCGAKMDEREEEDETD